MPVSVGVAQIMRPIITQMAQGAGMNNVPVGDPPKPNYAEWQLGFAVRCGLATLDHATYGAALIDRFSTRYATFTLTNALLFPADVAYATAIAATTGRTLAQVYRTAAHCYLARYTNDIHHFFIPSL